MVYLRSELVLSLRGSDGPLLGRIGHLQELLVALCRLERRSNQCGLLRLQRRLFLADLFRLCLQKLTLGEGAVQHQLRLLKLSTHPFDRAFLMLRAQPVHNELLCIRALYPLLPVREAHPEHRLLPAPARTLTAMLSLHIFLEHAF